jgi:electron transport complex protein RnfE
MEVERMNSCLKQLYNGIIKENPTFVLILGMCPTLAVTSSLFNGAGMGLSTMVVLVMSNLVISLLRKIIPNGVRVPAFIVIVASFVTILQFLLQAYLPALNDALGIYIPLIVVNCIILGRAESFASKNPVLPSIFDGLGMGLGFTLALSILGAFREIIGAGTVLGINIPGWDGITIFVMAPGAFFVLAALVATQNYIRLSAGKKPRKTCADGCSGCSGCDTSINNDKVKEEK